MSQFTDRMLEATFGFAKLALSNAILINGGAAAALIAFLGDQHVSPLPVGMYNAILRFAVGAGAGGAASMLAYFGQRTDWEVARHCENGEVCPRSKAVAANIFISSAAAAGASAYVLFFAGCYAAAQSLLL